MFNLESNDSVTDRAHNPFKLPDGTERILAMGERDRVAAKLEDLKYRLYQKQAKGIEYVHALAVRNIGGRENRSEMVRTVDEVGGPVIPSSVTYLMPISKNKAQDTSLAGSNL